MTKNALMNTVLQEMESGVIYTPEEVFERVKKKAETPVADGDIRSALFGLIRRDELRLTKDLKLEKKG